MPKYNILAESVKQARPAEELSDGVMVGTNVVTATAAAYAD